eukprot:4321909-Prymnesium_polylepis.2
MLQAFRLLVRAPATVLEVETVAASAPSCGRCTARCWTQSVASRARARSGRQSCSRRRRTASKLRTPPRTPPGCSRLRRMRSTSATNICPRPSGSGKRQDLHNSHRARQTWHRNAPREAVAGTAAKMAGCIRRSSQSSTPSHCTGRSICGTRPAGPCRRSPGSCSVPGLCRSGG